jgi:integrase
MALTEAVSGRYRALLICTAGTGLRQGEAFGLTLEYVHRLQRELRVEQQFVQIVGQPSFEPPKTESSRRKIPIPTFVSDALAAHIAEFGVGDHNLVFTDESGHPLGRNRFSRVWRPAVAAAVDSCPPHAVFYDLCHFYASPDDQRRGVSEIVQNRPGNTSAMETPDRYAHLRPDFEQTTRSAVDAAFKLASLRV